MPEYDIPQYDGKMLNYKNHAEPVSEWRKDKALHPFQVEANRKSHIPPPNRYNNMPKDSKIAPTLYNFDNKTYAAQLINTANKSKHIGPGHVDPKRNHKVPGNYTS